MEKPGGRGIEKSRGNEKFSGNGKIHRDKKTSRVFSNTGTNIVRH